MSIANVIAYEPINASWANDIRDRTIQRYASVAERDTQHPTPAEGDLSYLDDANAIYVHNGTSWIVPIPAAGIGPSMLSAVTDKDNLTETSVALALTTTYQAAESLTLPIPATWNTYVVHAIATGTYWADQGSLLGIEAHIQINTTNGLVLTFHGLEGASNFNHPFSVQSRIGAMIATGDIPITFRARETDASTNGSIRQVQLYARARRVT